MLTETTVARAVSFATLPALTLKTLLHHTMIQKYATAKEDLQLLSGAQVSLVASLCFMNTF